MENDFSDFLQRAISQPVRFVDQTRLIKNYGQYLGPGRKISVVGKAQRESVMQWRRQFHRHSRN